MWKNVSQLVLVVLLTLSCFGQPTPHQNAGTPYFAQAQKELAENPAADVLTLVRQGWTAVKAEGCSDEAYADGVWSASRLLSNLGRDLEVDAVTSEALAACVSPALFLVRAQIEIRHAHELARRRDRVKAEKFMKASAEREEAWGADSSALVSLRTTLAFMEEQQGDWKEAERILKAALAAGKPDQRTWPKDNFMFTRRALLSYGEPYQLLAALYGRHERTAEAVQIYRDHVADTQGTPQEHVMALRELAQSLAAHGFNEEAVKVQRQVLQVETSTAGPFNNSAGEKTTLASYEIRAGQKEEGMRILQSELERTVAEKGLDSPEYHWARSNLVENAIQAGEFEMAEKLAREDLERAQKAADRETGLLVNAMSNLSRVLYAKGNTYAAGELQKQTSEISLKTMSGRWGELQRSFAEVQKLNNEGKTAEAMARVESIAGNYFPFQTGEFWQFLPAAQSFLNVPQHKAEAVRVAEIVMSVAEREGLEGDPRSGSLLAEWANFYGGNLGDAATANKLLEQLETVIRECCGEHSPRMQMVLNGRLALTREPADRIAALERLRDFEVQVFGPDSQDAENSTIMLAQIYLSSGEWGMAQETYGKALEISSERDGMKTSQYVNLMGRVAMDFSNHGKHQAALEMIEQALKLCEGIFYSDRVRPNLEQVHRQILERMSQQAKK
jgi:tetratricopeptide (TPR) repeat protein